MSGPERKALREAVSEATRAALGPIARPGHPSRFGNLRAVTDTGREVWFPDLGWYDSISLTKPAILRALNG